MSAANRTRTRKNTTAVCQASRFDSRSRTAATSGKKYVFLRIDRAGICATLYDEDIRNLWWRDRSVNELILTLFATLLLLLGLGA